MDNKVKRGFLRLGVWSIFLMTVTVLSGCVAQNIHTPNQASVQPKVKDINQIQTEVQEQKQEQPQIQLQPQPQPQPQSQSTILSEPQSNSQPIKPQPQGERIEGIPILYYHSIEREAGNELRVPAEEFEAHMKYLQQAGYQSITLNELYRHYYEGLELPKKPFALTFDDGYADNYSNAFRIARKYGFTGTIFMVTDWIDGAGYLSKEQLQEMSAQGWQIEAHSVSHPKLNEIDSKQLERELADSKNKLEEILEHPVEFLAYPYGIYTEQVIQEARKVGYIMGFTTNRGWAEKKEPFRIQRVYCYANMGVDEFKRRVENPNY